MKMRKSSHESNSTDATLPEQSQPQPQTQTKSSMMRRFSSIRHRRPATSGPSGDTARFNTVPSQIPANYANPLSIPADSSRGLAARAAAAAQNERLSLTKQARLEAELTARFLSDGVNSVCPPPPGPVVEERPAGGGWGGWEAASLEKKRGKKSSVFVPMPDPPKEEISEVPAIPDTLENKEAPAEDDWMNWASTTTTKKKGKSEPELPPSPHPGPEPEPEPVVEDSATVQSLDGVEEPKTEEEDEWAMPSWSTKKSREKASHKSVIGPTNAKFDSGYSSMPDAVSESNEQDDDNRSIRSILTNASRVLLPPQQEEHLISAFVGDLCQDIGFCGDLGDARDRISARLPDLLKTFTLRLEGSVSSKTERDVKEFVRQQRE